MCSMSCGRHNANVYIIYRHHTICVRSSRRTIKNKKLVLREVSNNDNNNNNITLYALQYYDILY